ncbi:MAG: PDZ domain-containing protein [Pirellulales bacterium]|nr:PDZ domain-containing protein [Pirellulales bacterium]
MTIPNSRLTDGPHVRAAFRGVIENSSEATVRVECHGREVAIGGIIGPDGWVLTKASHLDGPIRLRLKDGRTLEAEVVGIQDDYDLAMLKVDARDLPILDLARQEQLNVGQWVVTPGTDRDPLAVGIVSVGPREIPKQSGILGIQIGDSDAGPRVERIFSNSGAAQAGILVNDVITSIDGKSTENRNALTQTIRKYSPGDIIQVGILRGQQKLTLNATLTERVDGMAPDRGAIQNRMGSELSKRRFGFPVALQHDTVLKPVDCGGPLVNLDGQTIGFNIARGGRTESYAIPTPVVMTLLYDLMSGNLAPADPESEQAAMLHPIGNPNGYPPEP